MQTLPLDLLATTPMTSSSGPVQEQFKEQEERQRKEQAKRLKKELEEKQKREQEEKQKKRTGR